MNNEQQITKVLQLLDLGKNTSNLGEIEDSRAEIEKLASKESDLSMRDFLEKSVGLLQSYQLRRPQERTLGVLERNLADIRKTGKSLLESE